MDKLARINIELWAVYIQEFSKSLSSRIDAFQVPIEFQLENINDLVTGKIYPPKIIFRELVLIKRFILFTFCTLVYF